jgi:hypothetical protein
MCNAAAAKFCSTCHSSTYCSVKCQKADWPLHKLLCRAIENVAPRPSDKHKLAILLPHDSNDPQLTWVKCNEIFFDVMFHEADTKQLLNVETHVSNRFYPGPENSRFDYNARRKFNYDHTVKLICRAMMRLDGSSANACVNRITHGRMSYDWRGPIVVMRVKGMTSDDPIYEDVKASDLRATVDHLLVYRKDPFAEALASYF